MANRSVNVAAMRRRHLFEFEDQSWLPAPVRDAITDFLREALVVGGRVYAPVIPLLVRVLECAQTDQIVDLCSGGSGPWTHLLSDLGKTGSSAQVLLTDKYPNRAAMQKAVAAVGPGLSFEEMPVDATCVPAGLTGVRTIFTAFHHFRSDQASGILRDAYQNRAGIGVFEFTERRPAILAKTLVVAPLMVLATMVRLRPTVPQLLLTYVCPIIPLAVTWDALVSNLRTYTPEELREMVSGLNDPGYTWEIGEIPGGRRNPPVTYLIGYPTAPPTQKPTLTDIRETSRDRARQPRHETVSNEVHHPVSPLSARPVA